MRQFTCCVQAAAAAAAGAAAAAVLRLFLSEQTAILVAH
jgi:hypothetical protein